MEKKYQVFVSSTYTDLLEERKIVTQTLLMLDCIPIGMELFPASDDDQWSFIKSVIDECDYYLLILAGRYGSCSEGGIGYTEMEYRYAVEIGKPVIAFLHKNTGSIASSLSENDPDVLEKLSRFQSLVKKKLCNFWETPAELSGVVGTSIVQLKKRSPAIGWIKADSISNERATDKELKPENKVNGLQSDYVLSHRISHYLRNSIAALQNLEFSILEKIDNTDSISHFDEILENDQLKRKEIFTKLGDKATGAICKQLENYFSYNKLESNIRVTIKSIISNEGNQLNWDVATLVVDPFTWNNQDRLVEKKEDELHKIKDNSDFQGILLGTEKCFVSNDLSKLDGNYKNSSKDWIKRYNSTMVVPIKNQPDGKNNSVYYGFLTVDSLNLKGQSLFDSDEDSPTFNILANAADALAVWFIKNDNHVKLIKNALTHREGLIILAETIAEKNINDRKVKPEAVI